MSSLWHSTRASLDDCLTLPRESLGKLQAGQSVDVAEVVAQLTMAAESARSLSALVSSELPEASWQNRRELDALIEKIQKNLEAKAVEELRSQLLALATELERGSIVHRRALRVSELNQLRELAIKELLSQAGLEGVPQTLPGPEAEQWMEWACNLKEPEDAEALQTLRNGFAHLDDFVANLEPGMWVVETAQATGQKREELEELQKSLVAQAEQLRSRLWDLAAELERGSIVHHRAFRVNQLNQLREQAIDELRSQAVAEGAPQTLPGPEAGEWVEWACGLKEPEDAEPLQILRDGFAQLDDFVANLEPDMWRAAGRPAPEILPVPEISAAPEILREPERSANAAQQEPFRPEGNGSEETIVSSGPLPIKVKGRKSSKWRRVTQVPTSVEPSQSAFESDIVTPDDVTPPQAEEEVEPVPAEKRAPLAGIRGFVTQQVARVTGAARGFTSDVRSGEIDLKTGVERLWGGKWRMRVATVVLLVLAALGAMQWWRSRRNHTSNGPVQAAERKISDLAPSTPEYRGPGQPVTTPDAVTQMSASNVPADKQSKPKDQNAAANPPSTAPPAKQASVLGDGVLRTPMPIPKNVALANGAPEGTDSAPGLPSGSPNSVTKMVSDIPVAVPKLAAQKVRVSSGVAAGLLIHQVTPKYPAQAREARVQGTVVLQAVIGKDGSVQSVHAVSGPPMLTPAAVEAVKQWRYKPYFLNGEPVAAETQINVKFTP